MPEIANVIIGGGSPFSHRQPKADTLNTLKLTDSNLREVAAHILKTQGGKVEVDEELHGIRVGFSFFRRGWLVEEYDFDQERIVFRLATTKERRKYDLR